MAKTQIWEMSYGRPRKKSHYVTPAQAGVQKVLKCQDSGFHRNDSKLTCWLFMYASVLIVQTSLFWSLIFRILNLFGIWCL